jgi:hypothetical protein
MTSPMAAAEPNLVPGYRHRPGNHCGSTALRNLLAFGGLELSEEMAFGLGAGACFYYVALPEGTPTRWLNGRTARLEENFVELTGVPLELRTADDPAESWALARDAVDAGRPALLLTDLYYLDHYGRSAHLPGHAVVLAGYDADVAYLSDTAFEELQTTRLENLAKARHTRHPAYPLSGHAFLLPDDGKLPDVREAAPRAVERAAAAMLAPERAEFQGMPALRRLAAEVGLWPEQADDWQWCARFGYQIIERRGSGGGNFRLMYSRFLAEAGFAQAPLAAESAGAWTALAEALREASESDRPDPAAWRRIGELAGTVALAEARLWTELAEAVS